MHTDRREIMGWSSRLSAAGDWERYAAALEALVREGFLHRHATPVI